MKYHLTCLSVLTVFCINLSARVIWTLPFLFKCLLFLSLNSLFWLRFPILLKRHGKNEYPCLCSDLRVNDLRFFPFRIMLAVSLFYFVDLYSFHTQLLRVLLWRDAVFCQVFFYMSWGYHMAFIYHSVETMYHAYQFYYFKTPINPWDKFHLINDL